jgi:hypothetical protein
VLLVLTVSVLIAVGVIILGILVWVGMTSNDEQRSRERQTRRREAMRDLDLRRKPGEHPWWMPSNKPFTAAQQQLADVNARLAVLA